MVIPVFDPAIVAPGGPIGIMACSYGIFAHMAGWSGIQPCRALMDMDNGADPKLKADAAGREGGFWIVRRELVLKLRHGLQFILGGVVNWILDADIRSFFDTVRCATSGAS